jgi:hypothetical protein
MINNILTSYFDYLLFESKGVPDFVEKIMETLKNINFKKSETTTLKENDISSKSIIKITYIDELENFNIKRIVTNFIFDDFDFNTNKFTIVNYNFATFKDTTKEDFYKHLAHEIHHSYELYNIFKSTRTTEMNISWKLNLKQQNFKERNIIFDDFLYILYKSLGLEINANIVGLYFKTKEIGATDKDEILEIIKTDDLYKNIKLMGDFHPDIFSKYIKENTDMDELKELINEFNESEIEIEKFFEKWNIFFKRQYKKYNEKINRMMELIINQKQNKSFQ